MAVLSAPTNTPTVDGATAVCVSDDATGTVYLSVRTDRAWYSVANGDSQGLVDADKAMIISGATDSNIVFADNQAASLDPEQLIDGLAARLDPANPYYVGWVQQEAIAPLADEFYTAVDPYTFTRTGVQTCEDADGLIVTSQVGQECHPFADYDGTTWTNTSGISKGVLLEGERTNKLPYSADFQQATYWTKGGDAAVADSAILAPDGSTNAEHVTGTRSGGAYLFRGTAALSGDIKSIWARTVSGTVSGTVSLLHHNSNGVQTLTEEWQRYDIRFDDENGTITESFYAVDFRHASTTLEECLVWEGQVETGDFVSSNINTTATYPVTRPATDMAATVAELGLAADIVNDLSGTLTTSPSFSSTDVTGDQVLLLIGSTTNGIELKVNQSTWTLTKYVSSTGYAATATSAFAAGDEKVIAFSIGAGGVDVDVDGQTGNDTDASDLITAIATVDISPGFHIVKSLAIT